VLPLFEAPVVPDVAEGPPAFELPPAVLLALCPCATLQESANADAKITDVSFICRFLLMIGKQIDIRSLSSGAHGARPRSVRYRSCRVFSSRNKLSRPPFSVHSNSWRRHMFTESRETGNLIGSDKVEGTAVYGADDQKIGSIERVMIDKVSGKVSYAVLSFGGFLGLGDQHYPLPWQSLKYDTSLGGYRTGITERQLEGAPKYGNDNSWNWSDMSRTRSINDYYGVPFVA
jgi:hypothetical protein